jgi:N6-adenosine-specific RNA methylase IME4
MNKKYQIIYADPPWEYGSITKLGNARNYYKTISFINLYNIQIPSDNNCLLFLWVVNQRLTDCILVAEKWGFKYVGVGFVWHKPNRTLCGYYTMAQTEQCLIFKKGKIPQPRGSRNQVQFLSEKATRHSKKPNEIRNRITKMFPTQNKIELFAREKVKDWDVWGNEVESDIKLK